MFPRLKIDKGIFLIVLFGLVLRLFAINQSFWLDEATSALVVRDFSLTEIFTKFLPGDFHPPLYYVFLKGWSAVFGYSELALRSMSLFFGLLSIVLVFFVTQRLFENKKISYLASTLLATSGLHVYYSQEARMYSMATFFVLLAIYYFQSILKKDARLGEWLVFSLLLALVLLTDYLSGFILLVFWVYVLFFRKGKDWRLFFILAHIPLAIMAFYWREHFLSQLALGSSVENANPVWWQILGQGNLKNIFLIFAKFIIGRVTIFNKFVYFGVLGILSLFFANLLLRPIFTRNLKPIKQYFFVWLWLAIPIVAGIIISLAIPVLSYFRYLFVLPAFYILVAKGVFSFKDRRLLIIKVLLVVNLVSTFYYLFNPRFHREDWQGFARTVASESTGPYRVVFPSDNHHEGYTYYAGDDHVSGYLVLLTNYKTVWFVRYLEELYPKIEDTRLRAEEIGFVKTQERDFNGIVVWKYEMKNK